MKIKLFFLVKFLFLSIQSVKSKDNSEIQLQKNISISSNFDVSMNIYKKEEIIDTIYLNLTNHSKIVLSDIKFAYTGKILYLNEYNAIDVLKDKNINYRIKWIFLFDSIKELSIFVDAVKKRKLSYFTNAIIISKNLAEASYNYFDYLVNLKVFIFYLESEQFKYLIENFDYKTEENIYARLLSKNIKEYKLGHLYKIIFLCLIILIFCINIFRYKLNTDNRNLTFFFIRTVYFFPIIKVPITFFFIMKLKFLPIYNDLFNIGSTSLINFIISSLDIFFKSLFITYALLASKGIDEIIKISNQLEFTVFMRKFIFIYIILSSSLINNRLMFIVSKYFVLFSLIFESFIFHFIYKYKRISQTEYIKKLNLAFLYCNEYVPSLKLKLKMIIWHWRIYLLYFTLLIFLDFYIILYNIIEEEKGIYYHFLDCMIILCYCLIYRPRKWPENFEVCSKNDFCYFDNIYSCNILSDDIDINNTDNINDNDNNFISNDLNNSDNEREKLNASETLKLRNKRKKSVKSGHFGISKFYRENEDFPIVILNPEFFLKINRYGNEKNVTDIFSNCIKNCSLGTFNKTN